MPFTRREFVLTGASAALAARVGLPSDPAGERPNVLVVVIDTLRADHAFGERARTPNIDALAREGLRFTRTYPEAMPTVPVRNSILSGRRGFPFRGWHDYEGLMESPGWSPLRDVPSTWTSVLRDAGYWTAYVTDNPFLGFSAPYERLRRSFDLFIRRGGQIGGRTRGVSERRLRHWLHPAIADEKATDRIRRYLANGDHSRDGSDSFAARVFGDGARTLEQAARRRPFAMVVDTFEPHEPWTPPRRYLEQYGDPDWRGPEPASLRYGRTSNWLGADEQASVLARLRALYAAEVTMTDRFLGVLLDRLYDLRLADDTVVVLVADHGIFLGERGWTGKISAALHPELTHVPLIVVDPQRGRAGQASEYFASPHDLGRTILSMTGTRAPRSMEGVDLSRLFQGRSPPERPYAHGGYANYHYLRDGRWAYFSDNRMREPRLFDLTDDRGEGRDVADRHPSVVRGIQSTIRERAAGRPPYYPK